MKKMFSILKVLNLIIFVLLIIATVNAKVTSFATSMEFEQQPLYRINHLLQYLDTENDYIPEGKPLEVQIVYSCEDIDEWNSKYANYTITGVNLTIIELHRVNQYGQRFNVSPTRTTINLDEMETPFDNAKSFVKLYHRDTITVELNTNFQSLSISGSPCDFYLLLPTWDCNACSEYEYILVEEDIALSQNIIGDRGTVYDRIKRLIQINYEVLLIIYWVILISVLIFLVALMIYSIVFVYRFLKRYIP